MYAAKAWRHSVAIHDASRTLSTNRRVNRRKLVGGASAVAAGIGLGSSVLASGGVSQSARFARAQDKETIDVTSIRFIYGTPAPLDGPGLEMINERFAFNYKPMLVPEATYTEKLTTVIASGDVPDIVAFKAGDSNYYKWAAQGAFLDLEPYLADYPSFGLVSQDRLNNTRVGGTLFAMPTYYPLYSLTPSIRQDWLDALGLTVPTNYDEFKNVALAFTEQDPTGGTGGSTYGVAMGKLVNPAYAFGGYWDPGAWYDKDDQGRLIPGVISTGTRERLQLLTDLYAAGAVTQDFAVLDWGATNKEFYGNKAGIFIGAPRGMSQDYFAGLTSIAPDASPVPINAFVAPDGSQGFTAASGIGGMWAISAKVGDDKLKRILEFLDYARTYYPPEEQTADNADYAWNNGGEGKGFEVVDGKVVSLDSGTEPKGLAPLSYFVDVTSWPPSDDAIDYSLGYTKEPRMGEWAKALQDMWTASTPYTNPANGIISETQQQKGTEISDWVLGEHTKIIAGQRSLDSWDDLVAEYLAKGGEQIIEETNAGIQERDGA
jgi:putative aldouronate transport system substrate-binding protein